MLRALVWFGDNELEVVALECDGCGRSWLERLLVMNCMAISCKLKGISIIPIMVLVKVAKTKHVKVIYLDVIGRVDLR